MQCYMLLMISWSSNRSLISLAASSGVSLACIRLWIALPSILAMSGLSIL